MFILVAKFGGFFFWLLKIKKTNGVDELMFKSYPNSGRALASKAMKLAKPIAVATRCSANFTGTTLAGTVAGVTYRYAHVMETECSNLQIGFANFYPTATTESSNANAITIAVTLEYNGASQRLHFNGSRTKTIDQGGFALCDPFWRDIPKGATFYTRTWVSVPVDTNTYPQGIELDSALGDGKGTGDLSLNTGALTSTTEAGFGPAVIIGVPKDVDAAAFALIGDSIITSPSGIGWAVKLVEDNNCGYSILSRPGSNVTTMQSNSANSYRLRLMKYFTHAIVNFGRNDFNSGDSLATVETRLKDLWRALDMYGLKVYQSTTMPATTSTDGWTTVANQAINNTNSFNTKRLEFNSKLRSGVYPVTVLDISPAVESSAGSNIWKANFTTDGVHPNAAARDAMAASVSLGLA